MGEPRGGFRPAARRRAWQGSKIARDERLIYIDNGIAVLGEPPPQLLASTQRPPDTVGGVPVLVQGGGEGIQGGPHRCAARAGDHRSPRIAVLDHRLLLCSEG